MLLCQLIFKSLSQRKKDYHQALNRFPIQAAFGDIADIPREYVRCLSISISLSICSSTCLVLISSSFSS